MSWGHWNLPRAELPLSGDPAGTVETGVWVWTPWHHRISEQAELLFQANRTS